MSLLFLFCAVIFGASPRMVTGLGGESAGKTVRSAVSVIDRTYLRAKTNPAWKEAKRKLLAGEYQSPVQAYQALAAQLARVNDPDLYLVNAEEYRDRKEEFEARRVGTGLPSFAIVRDPANDEVRVVTALGDSPAARAGIRPRDLIVSIDGRPTKGMSHQQVIDALGMETHGSVRLMIRRGGHNRRLTLIPSDRPLDAVQFTRKTVGQKRIGYIRVLLFTPDAGQLVRQAVATLRREGVDGFVLDLRNNPGGLMPAAERTASVFTAGVLGTEVREKGPAKRLLTHRAPLTGKPLVILINGGTASAAEMLAGGLRDLHRAVLVGTQTFGRGRTQTYVPLSDGYGVVVPNAEIHTPNGRPFKTAGIRPDLEVSSNALPEGKRATRHDEQFQKAVALLAHS